MPKGLFGEGLLDGVYLRSKAEKLWGQHTQLEERMDRLNEEIQAKAKEKVKKKRKLRGDRGSTEPHKLGQPGSSPGPASKKEVGHAVKRGKSKHGRRKKGEGSCIEKDQPHDARESSHATEASSSGSIVDAESGEADTGGELHPGEEKEIVGGGGDFGGGGASGDF